MRTGVWSSEPMWKTIGHCGLFLAETSGFVGLASQQCQPIVNNTSTLSCYLCFFLNTSSIFYWVFRQVQLVLFMCLHAPLPMHWDSPRACLEVRHCKVASLYLGCTVGFFCTLFLCNFKTLYSILPPASEFRRLRVFFRFILMNSLNTCSCVFVCVSVSRCSKRPEEGADYLGPELQVVVSQLMWVLETEHGSGRAANALSR